MLFKRNNTYFYNIFSLTHFFFLQPLNNITRIGPVAPRKNKDCLFFLISNFLATWTTSRTKAKRREWSYQENKERETCLVGSQKIKETCLTINYTLIYFKICSQTFFFLLWGRSLTIAQFNKLWDWVLKWLRLLGLGGLNYTHTTLS